MDTHVWHESLRRIVAEGDWDALRELRHATNQAFASALDDAGLRAFYSALALTLAPEERVQLEGSDSDAFRVGIRDALGRAAAAVAGRSAIKGIYLEYFFDGGDACTANMFLCTSYSDTEDQWGADFEADGFIEGPDVPAYFRFDPDFEWPDLARQVGEEFANGMLLAACIAEWKDCGIRGLPLGFANHDHEMVRIPVRA